MSAAACRDGRGSGDMPPHQTSSMHAVMRREQCLGASRGRVQQKQLLAGGGVWLGWASALGNSQVVENYPCLANKMLLFKPKVPSHAYFSSFF